MRCCGVRAIDVVVGTLALSGHQDIRNSFCFLLDSVVPWHWCSYSKSYSPYLQSPILDRETTCRPTN